jgi:hypothetical protein
MMWGSPAKLATGVAVAGFAGFQIDEAGRIHVTLSKQAKSYLLHRFDQTRSWYDVRLAATAEPR